MAIIKTLVYGLLAAGVASAKTTSVDEVMSTETQRRLDLQEQGPMSKKEAEFMRKLISKDVLRIVDKPEDLKAQREALTANNPFAKAFGNNKESTRNDATNDRRSRGTQRRTQERGATKTQRRVSNTQRKGSRKSSKSGGTE